MKIKKSRIMGFCMGVQRAVTIAEQTLQEADGKAVYILGDLIHNPVVMSELHGEGLIVENDSDNIHNAIVLVRAHGIAPAIKQKLVKQGNTIVDATCTRVLYSQEMVAGYRQKGYHCIIVGDKNHGEIKGLIGFAESHDFVQDIEAAKQINLPEKVCVVGQTTLKRGEYDAVCDILKKRNPELVVCNSICSATEKRQEAMKELARVVDAIIVVGGKNSANTKRLAKTARMFCDTVYHIELPGELPDSVFTYENIGITAGASTPGRQVDVVEQYLKAGKG